jgi:hypothetical protein
MSPRSFKYQERSKDDWRERANMKGGQFDTYIKPAYRLYKAKDGKNVIRILPPTWEKARHYGYDIHVNYQIGPDNQAYLSLSKMLGKPDPIAEARTQAEREGDEALGKALRPTHRILMWVIDRLDEEQGPQLYPAPFSKVDKAFINLAYDQDTGEIIEVDNPEEGCDIRFYKEGANLGTDYPASKMRLLEPGPISDDEKKQQQWLDYVAENPIPDCLNYYDYDHISGVFNGGAPKPKDEDPEPAPRGRKRPEPEPEPESDPEPEPAPRSASRRARPGDASPEEEAAPKSESLRDRIRRRHQVGAKPAEED